MAKLPPRFDRVDSFGIAPIHLCAILNKLNDPAIQTILAADPTHPSMQDLMPLQTNGQKRDEWANRVVHKSKYIGDVLRSPANQISGFSIDPLNLGNVDAWQLAGFFGSTPPSSCAVKPGNTTSVSPSSLRLPTKDPQKALCIYYLPFAYGRALRFINIPDHGVDCVGPFLESCRQVMAKYDPARGYSPVTLAMRTLDGTAKNLLKKIKKFENKKEQNKEHLDQWDSSQGGQPVYLDSTTEAADGSAVSIYEKISDPNAKDPAKEAALADDKHALDKVMDKLDPRDRKIIEMHSSGIEIIVIAQKMGMKRSTIYESIPRIKKQLQQLGRQFQATGV